MHGWKAAAKYEGCNSKMMVHHEICPNFQLLLNHVVLYSVYYFYPFLLKSIELHIESIIQPS